MEKTCDNCELTLICKDATSQEIICVKWILRKGSVPKTKLPTLSAPEYPEHKVSHRFFELIEEMKETFVAKNHDYAGKDDPFANLRASRDLGISPVAGVVLRLNDKFSRLKSFLQQGVLKVKEESIVDTLKDISVYCLIAIILYEEEKENGS